MIECAKLSGTYDTRVLDDGDADDILELCLQNPQFYEHSSAQPTRGQIRHDMTLMPPGVDRSAKCYCGFFDHDDLVAVMDLVDGYPNPDTAYIGFFMMGRAYQGKGIGTALIDEVVAYLSGTGKTAVRLAIDKGNPQATHFWKKNGFNVVLEVEVDGCTKLVAERTLA